jgi:MFS family permease
MTNPTSPAAGAAGPGDGRRFAALHVPAFRALWLGLIVSNAGSQMQNAAQFWLVYELHSEPIYLGLLSLSFALPMLVLTPIGGAIADRVSPRLLFVTQTLMLLQAVTLAVLTLGGWIQYWHLLALSAIYATLLSIDNPARQGLMPDLVRREELPSAVSLASVAFSGAALFGPAIAGLLLVPLGPGGLFAINACSYVVVLGVLIRLRELPRHARQPKGSIFGGVVQGFRYVGADRPISRALLLSLTNNMLGRSYTALMPIFARDVLQVGAVGYGFMLAAPGAGALTAGFGLAAARELGRRGRLRMMSWFGFALTLILFSFSRSYPLSLALLFLAGLCATTFNATSSTLLQFRAAGQFRGRVMSLMASSNIGGGQFGGMLNGSLANFIGAPEAVATCAVVLVLIGSATALRGGWRYETGVD